jgi:hypothetical protein
VLGLTGAVKVAGEVSSLTLVYWVKNMREIRYVIILREEDAKVVGYF